MFGFKLFRFSRYQRYEDTKGVSETTNRVSNCNPKKARQYNDQQKKNTRTNKELQNTTQKTKDRATRTPLKTRGASIR